MLPKKIYLIRHGQTDFNRRGIVQGSGIDADLNDHGRWQSEKFYQKYKDVAFQKVYTSRLKRSWQSVKGFIDDGLPLEKRESLNEINWGHREGEKITAEENAYYHSLVHAWKAGDTNKKIEGGESPEEVKTRLVPVVKEWMTMKEDLILACLHGRTLRILMTMLLNYPLRDMDQFHHGNLGLYEMVFTGSLWRVERYNDHNHFIEPPMGD